MLKPDNSSSSLAVKRFLRLFLVFLGALPLMAAYPLYKVVFTLSEQVGIVRTLAGGMQLGAAVAAVALVLSIMGWLLGWGRMPSRLGVMLLVSLSMANFAAIGLNIFFASVRNAPAPIVGLAGVTAILVCGQVLRRSLPDQLETVRPLLRLGFLLTVLPFLSSPYVLISALTDDPRMPHGPVPPKATTVLPHAPRRIVLVTFDALRFRGTTLQDPRAETTPHLKALANESFQFDRCFAASDRTQVSMATVLTGGRIDQLYAGIHNHLAYLREGYVPGLGAQLAPAGYRSYYSATYIHPSMFGLGGDFRAGKNFAPIYLPNWFNRRAFLPIDFGALLSDFRSVLTPSVYLTWTHHLRAAKETVDEAQRYLQQDGGRTFLWVHIGLPHDPYYQIPMSETGDSSALDTYEKLSGEDLMTMRGPERLPAYERGYRATTRFADAQFGRLLASLKADPAWSETMLVVTSDHGESIQLGQMPHGTGVISPDIAHVPLLVHLPHQQRGARIESVVSHEDIVPTILSQVYSKPPEGFPGLALFSQPQPLNRVVYTWAMLSRYFKGEESSDSVAAFQGNLMFRLLFPGGRESLHEITQDATASTDLTSKYPQEALRLRRLIKQEFKI